MSRSSKRKEASVPEAAAAANANPAASSKRTRKDDAQAAQAMAALDAANAIAAAAAAADTKPPPKKRTPEETITITSITKEPNDPTAFTEYLFWLLNFKADNGNFHCSKDDQAQLHAFLHHLKREYKNYVQDPTSSVLTSDQMKVLEYLHVPLTSRGDDHWNRFFELLQQYRQRHGHVLVPRLCEVPGLGDWVTDQRRQYKQWKQGQPSQLSQERREKLEALEFCWQVRNRPEWDNRYQELLEYKEKNGDCKVPQHYKENRALGKWVAKQREQYKLLKKGQHSFLTPYRLEKLNQIGFCWSIRTAMEHENEMAAAVAALPDPDSKPKNQSPQQAQIASI